MIEEVKASMSLRLPSLINKMLPKGQAKNFERRFIILYFWRVEGSHAYGLYTYRCGNHIAVAAQVAK